MKKNIIFILLIIWPNLNYSQDSDWIVFSRPSPPMIKDTMHEKSLVIGIEGGTKKNDLNISQNIKTEKTKFHNFVEPYSSSLPDNFINCITLDPNGYIWVGTNRGAAKYDGTGWTVYNSSNSGLKNNIVSSIAIDNSEKKWIGTNSGLAEFDGNAWRTYTSKNSKLPDNVIYSVAVEKNGIRWIGTTNGLVKIDNKKWTVYKKSNSGLPDNHISGITIDDDGNKWIATYNGVAKFNGRNWKVFKTSNSKLSYNDVYSVTAKNKDEIFFSTWGGGLTKLIGNRWSVYKKSNSGLTDNYVSSTIVDNNGNVWAGTLYGLAKFNGKKWTTYRTYNSGLPDNRIYTLLLDGSGNLWVGTHEGLTIFKEGGIISSPPDVYEFKCMTERNKIHLHWYSQNERSNYGFEIQKKGLNSNWETIGSVDKNRVNNKPSSYHYIDEHFGSEKVFYRIKQIDFEGNYKYSNIAETTVEIPDNIFLKQKYIFNRNEQVKIQLGLSKKTFLNISIYDLLGRKIYVPANSYFKAGYHEVRINKDVLPNGVFFCEIQADNIIEIKKMQLAK